jgi:uncharacterized lipoprotein
MKNHIKLLLAGLVLSGMGACANTGCNNYHAYRTAKAATPVQVPADLEQPDNESVAPAVTVTDPNKVHKRANGECLDKPPKL